MSYFITGTDTGVGKTLISCALLHGFAAQGKRVVGFKPVAAGGSLRSSGAPTGVPLAVAAGGSLRSSGAPTGVPLAGAADFDNDYNDDALALRAASTVQVTYGQINPYCFVPPIAPHLAARQSGVQINFVRILNSYRELAAQADVVIAEGAGGFRVPLNDTQDSADLAVELGLPVILVVGMRLGCLNHALLTAEAIAVRGLVLAGWVANAVTDHMTALEENVLALQQRIPAPLLGVVPYATLPDAAAVAGQLNLELLMANERQD